jgi:hypothetical protein
MRDRAAADRVERRWGRASSGPVSLAGTSSADDADVVEAGKNTSIGLGTVAVDADAVLGSAGESAAG